MTASHSIPALAARLISGATSSRALVEACLERATAPAGEGARAYIRLDAEEARRAADAMDALRATGYAPSQFAGIPIAIKDLADIKHQVTAAGSTVLADAPPATADAPVVTRLRAAGFIILGRTNMTEFAYSGLGINPHYGTPLSVWDRTNKRVPGGSSSGSAVAVADGMAWGALGTDTGGSCRIPAAFNGITGYKPTARRVPTAGVVPLSTSLDSIGPIGRTVECCNILDAVMAGDDSMREVYGSLAGARLLVPETVVLDGLDKHVAADFEAALGCLSKAGARITRARFQPFEMITGLNLSAAESWHWHRDLVERRGNDYDPRVLARILRGKAQTAADYIELLAARQRGIEAFETGMQDYDGLVCPTVAMVPPRIADCAADDDYNRINMLALRNTMLLNILDGCSIALPMSRPGAPPTSLMLSGPAMSDERVLGLAGSIELALSRASLT